MPTIDPTEGAESPIDDEAPAVRLASIHLHPQTDGRLTLSITFSPAASELLRALELAGGKRQAKARPPKPAGKVQEPRVKRPPKARNKKMGWMESAKALMLGPDTGKQ